MIFKNCDDGDGYIENHETFYEYLKREHNKRL